MFNLLLPLTSKKVLAERLVKPIAVVPAGSIFVKNGEVTCGEERFASFSMDEQHLVATARYCEMNPVGARLVENPEDYRWSSAHAHLIGKDDELTKAAPLLELIPDWRSFLKLTSLDEVDLLHLHERTGRLLGKGDFIDKLEIELGRRVRA